MKIRKLYILCIAIMIAALLCMGFNWIIFPLPDAVIRVTGVIMLMDIFVLSYGTVKLRNQ